MVAIFVCIIASYSINLASRIFCYSMMRKSPYGTVSITSLTNETLVCAKKVSFNQAVMILFALVLTSTFATILHREILGGNAKCMDGFGTENLLIISSKE